MAKRSNNNKPFYLRNGFWIAIGVLYLIGFIGYKTSSDDADDYDYVNDYNGTVEIVVDDEEETLQDEIDVTPEMTVALAKAEQHNKYAYLSYKETIELLVRDGVAESDAIYAADNCQVDWEESAYNRAVQYVENIAISEARVGQMLDFNGYTEDEKEYAMSSLFVDWNDEAAQYVDERINSENATSYKSLLDSMEYDGFTSEQIEYAISGIDVDWDEMALKAAEEILKTNNVSESGLKQRLEWKNFTSPEVKYAVKNVKVDWNREAKDRAKEYLIYRHTSYKGVYDVLITEKFEPEYAEYGASNCGADWEEEAELVAAEYIKNQGDSFTKDEYRAYMSDMGFEDSEIDSALAAVIEE